MGRACVAQLHNTARVFKNKVAAEVERIQNEKGKDLQFSDVAHLVAGDRGRKVRLARALGELTLPRCARGCAGRDGRRR